MFCPILYSYSLNLLQHAHAMAKALLHVMSLDYVLANLISSANHAMNASKGTLTFHVVRVSKQTVLWNKIAF